MMWRTLSFLLLSLVFTSECVKEEYRGKVLHDSEDQVGPAKQRRIDKRVTCLHDKVSIVRM